MARKGPQLNDSRPAVGHLVTPYLFPTGSWIHSQLLHNPRFRSVVMTQQIVNPEAFPFAPIYDFSADRSGLSSIPFQFSKYFLGRFPQGPYRFAVEHEAVSLLHAHLGWEGARTVHLRDRLGIPHITSFYGRDANMLARNWYWRRLYRRLFREGDLFLAEGRFMAHTLERIGCPSEKVRVVHLGVDLTGVAYEPRSPGPAGEVVGLIAASFREKKGIRYALEAFARVAPRWPGLTLRIIGDGPLRSSIERQIRSLDLTERVTLLGYLDFPLYLQEIRSAHFLLAPSVTASDGDSEGGAPVCILDAQSTGLPVLTTNHCDIPEVTVPDRSAYLSPERDVDALTANLERFLSEPRRWADMGRAGRAHVEAEYDVRRQAEKMAVLYEGLITGTARSGSR